MARKPKTTAVLDLPVRHVIQIWKGRGDSLHFLSDAPQAGTGSTKVASVDVGRPFRHHVPSSGKGPSGLVFEGMTGENARPWTPSRVLAAARFGLFGFTLEGS